MSEESQEHDREIMDEIKRRKGHILICSECKKECSWVDRDEGMCVACFYDSRGLVYE